MGRGRRGPRLPPNLLVCFFGLQANPHAKGSARMRPRQLWRDSTAQKRSARAEPIQTRNLKLLHAVLGKRQPQARHIAAAAMDTAVVTMRP